jgi:murein DD-endopeptidase MepM/ murein hydrolase activator NlpD
MHIIITDSKHTKVRSFELSLGPLLLATFGLLVVIAGALWSWWPLTAKSPATAATPRALAIDATDLSALMARVRSDASASPSTEDRVAPDAAMDAEAVQQNIDALAKRLGVMQARMIQLDALSERLAELAGVPKLEQAPDPSGEGGLLMSPRSMTAQELSSALDALTQDSEERLAWLAVIEDSLLKQEWADALKPGLRPVDDLRIGSAFGRRIDPITGQVATHTGLDFPGPVGTPVKATAGGVVVSAAWHAGYGRLVEIDHGDEVVTRYAHLKEFKVRQGDLVRPGQVIGLLGNSGRSTGPHLHFEVWVGGRVRNPRAYLRDHARVARAP